MPRAWHLLLRTVVAVLGLVAVAALIAPSEGGGTAVVAVAVAVAVCAIAAVVVFVAMSGPRTALVRARGAIDPSVLPSQSDPDAAGHSRPRAPGCAAAAA